MAGIYIHIPFCRIRCIYCDFYSQTSMLLLDDYVSALLKELALRDDFPAGSPVETVYFGGGTPSLLQHAHFERIFEALYNRFSISEGAEITIECNPDDMTAEYVSMLRKFPFNRISIGVQSFSDVDLMFLKRRHTASQAIDAISRCQDVGYSNISIDLMYGLPDCSSIVWRRSLEKALSLHIPHISAYNLIYEEGTAISHLEVRRASEEHCAALFADTNRLLAAADYLHYEISNYALRTPERPEGASISRHNTSYWRSIPYLGLGAAAHSYNNDSRSWNVANLQRYIAAASKGLRDCSVETLGEQERYNDYLITRLRTVWGIALDELEKEFGAERKRRFLSKTRQFEILNILKNDGATVKFFEEKWFVCDAALRELIEI